MTPYEIQAKRNRELSGIAEVYPSCPVVHRCSHPGCCLVDVLEQCDICGNFFCSDHGSRGGDRPARGGKSQCVGDEAVPAMCFACGGFNADA